MPVTVLKISFIRLVYLKHFFGFISDDEFTILVQYEMHVELRL